MRGRDGAFSSRARRICCSLTHGALTPVDVVKTRLMTQVASEGVVLYKGAGDACVRILKEEGVGAFYKGIVPRVSYVAPLFGISATINTLTKRAFVQRKKSKLAQE